MSELQDLHARLRDVIVYTCNKIGCADCDLKWNDDKNTCSATDLSEKIEVIEMAEFNQENK